MTKLYDEHFDPYQDLQDCLDLALRTSETVETLIKINSILQKQVGALIENQRRHQDKIQWLELQVNEIKRTSANNSP